MHGKVKEILLLTVIVVILFAVVIIVASRQQKKSDEDISQTHSEQSETTYQEENLNEDSQSTTEEENVEDEPITDLDGDYDESGTEVNSEEIEKIEVNIKNMKDEIYFDIKDYGAFVYAIKEFFYKFGIMETEVECLNQVEHDYADNLIYYSMYVKGSAISYFDIVYDINKNIYYIVVI